MILYTVVAFVCFLWLLISGLKKYLQDECHLAAKFGTNFAMYVFFAVDDFDLGVVLLFFLSDMCYCHHIEMISVIKFLLSFGFSCCSADWAKYHVLCYFLELVLFFSTFDRIFVGLC